MALFARNFLTFFLTALWILILARVIISWIDPQGRNAISAFIIQTTEPILAPIRRLLPRTAGFDLSPLIVLLILSTIERALV